MTESAESIAAKAMVGQDMTWARNAVADLVGVVRRMAQATPSSDREAMWAALVNTLDRRFGELAYDPFDVTMLLVQALLELAETGTEEARHG